MKSSNLNNEYLDDEIDLRELLRTILNSKKLIIIVTLAFSLLAYIYTTQKELEYQSTVILDVGTYDLNNGEKKIIEPVSSLIRKLKVYLVYKKQLELGDLRLNGKKLKFKSIEDQLLQINYTSPSPEFNETIINEAITFSQESHAEGLDIIVNSFSEKIKSIESQQESQKLIAINSIMAIDKEIEFKKLNAINSLMAIDKEIEFLKNSIESQQESQKLNAINSIKAIDNEIEFLKNSLESKQESQK